MKIITVFLLFIALIVGSEIQNNYETFKSLDNEKDSGSSFFGGARIVGGQTAVEGQLPYQVGLQLYFSQESTFCGGTLISKRSILTAAHCCEGAVRIVVVLGSVQIYNQSEPNRKVIRVTGRSIKVHEGWMADESVNDICMINLPKEVELSEHVAIADLPNDDSRDFYNENVIASGWGRSSDGSIAISPSLRYAKMTVISNRGCNFYFLGSVRDTHMCTSGKGGVSTCNGDSGGPLVLEKTTRRNFTVVGITSYGTALGCERGWPAVYTRVTKYLDWIQTNMV